jgi:hypothetical protein
MLLKIHQMIILSTLRYVETAYGSDSNMVLRKLEPIHHRGVRLALGTFAVCKTELCEARLPTLTEMSDENTMKTGIRILTNGNHPTRSQTINRNIYEDYAMKPGSPRPLFIRAAELLGQMDIDGRKVKKTPDYVRPPWYTDDGKSIDWCLCKMRKRTPKYNDHSRIYTDRSKKEEKVGYAVVTDMKSTRKRIRGQSSIFSAEATNNGGQRSDIYSLTKDHNGCIRKQPLKKSED